MRLLLFALLACGEPATDAHAGDAPTLHGVRPEAAKPLPAFRAVAQDGAPRDRAALLGKPTALWFYPAANTPG